MASFSLRAMDAGDLAAVERIYKAHTAAPPALGSRGGKRLLRDRVEEILARHSERAVAIVGVDEKQRVRGYLVGDVRSWEFGSAPAGWIFALGVDPRVARLGLGKLLLDGAVARFNELGVSTVRTMVRKEDVPVLRFFRTGGRTGGFTAGPYVELELDLAR